jgi:hypothetical protein
VLKVVRRLLTHRLLDQAGLKQDLADSGAVTLIWVRTRARPQRLHWQSEPDLRRVTPSVTVLTRIKTCSIFMNRVVIPLEMCKSHIYNQPMAWKRALLSTLWRTNLSTLSNHITTRPVQTVFKLACVAAILAGCGGGGTGATSTTSSFASGPIQGLGSIIVNRVRFDNSSASVASDDDDNNEVHGSGELKVGMVVTVQGGAITTDISGARHSKATQIHFGSELVGPATFKSINVDNLTGTFTVLGQVVTVDSSTVWDDSIAGGFSSLADSTVVEVHGLLAAGTYTATRVEAKSNAQNFKIRGVVEDVNATDSTITIGGQVISLANLVPVPVVNTLDIVRVKVALNSTPNRGTSANPWVALRVKSGIRKIEDHSEAEIKGTVADFVGKTFSVNGTKVDATNVANLPTFTDGAFVEVHGRMEGDTLIATAVEIEDRNAPGAGEMEFHRIITSATGQSIVFGTGATATTISWNDNTSFANGATSASLTPNTCVEVKAVTVSGNTTLRATRIKLDDSCTQ